MEMLKELDDRLNRAKYSDDSMRMRRPRRHRRYSSH
jgi:hypothetical protein